MELKFERTPCRCLRCLTREVRNVEQTQELRIPDGMPDIGRVLCAWGQAMLRSKEWRGNGMSASGGVTVWVLYAPDDGTDPQCVDVWIPFQAKWDFPETDREGIISQVPLVRCVDARTVSARKLMIRANVGILAEAMEPYEVPVFTPGVMPDGVELLRHTYQVRLTKEAGEKAFVLDEELTLPGSRPAMEKLLRYELLPQQLESRVMSGKVVFRGNGLLHILYRGKDGCLHTWDFEIPFSQFGELQEDTGPDAQARIAMALTSLELDKMEDGALRLKCGLVSQYVIEDQVLLELAEDAYSPQREVTPAFQDIGIPAVLDVRMELVNAEAEMEMDAGRVVDLCFLPEHMSVDRMADRVSISQSGAFQLLYEDSGGTLQSAVRRWEQEKIMEAAEECVVTAAVSQSGFPVAQPGGGVISLKAGLNMHIQTGSARNQQVLSGMELGEMKKPDPNRPSVILRRADGERLWDLAKGCGTTVKAICQANGLSDEPESGRMLLIPVM